MARPGSQPLKPDPHKTDRATIVDPTTTQEMTGRPRLVVVSGLLLGHEVEIGDEAVVVGRGSDCALALPHPSVSRHHCRIWHDDGRFHIEDLDSTNHTYLNGKAVARAELRDGDQVGVGSNALKFFVGSSMDARYHDELIDLAIYDSLTGFCNRRRFESRLAEEIVKARAGQALALLMLDLDHFKAINDRHGHLVGDQALAAVAQILRDGAPDGAVIGRFGGEEFSVLLPGTGLAIAVAVAENLRKAVAAAPLALQELQLAVTISIGVAACSGAAADAATLLHAADDELYRAKQRGRNRVSPSR